MFYLLPGSRFLFKPTFFLKKNNRNVNDLSYDLKAITYNSEIMIFRTVDGMAGKLIQNG
jgi:hypothetical protein